MRYGSIVPTSLSPTPPPSHTKTQLETAAASQQRAFLTLIRNGDCSCRLITAWDSAVQCKVEAAVWQSVAQWKLQCVARDTVVGGSKQRHHTRFVLLKQDIRSAF